MPHPSRLLAVLVAVATSAGCGDDPAPVVDAGSVEAGVSDAGSRDAEVADDANGDAGVVSPPDSCAEAALRGGSIGCQFTFTTLDFDREGVMAVTIANAGTRTVEVTMTSADGAEPVVRRVAAGTGSVIEVTRPVEYESDSAGRESMFLRSRAARLTSTGPITAHLHTPYAAGPLAAAAPGAGGAMTLLSPDTFVGRQYVALGQVFAVVASSPGETELDVRVSVGTYAGLGVPALAAGSLRRFRLQERDILILRADSFAEFVFLDGTQVDASKPVSVFTGIGNEALLSTDKWGTVHAIALQGITPCQGSPTAVQVTASADGARVTVMPSTAGDGVELGAFESARIQLSAHAMLQSDQPIEVVQFVDGETCPAFGQTDLSVVPPWTSGIRTGAFFATPTVVRRVVDVTCATTPILDGLPLAGIPTMFGSIGSVWSVQIDPGFHTLVAPTPFVATLRGVSANIAGTAGALPGSPVGLGSVEGFE